MKARELRVMRCGYCWREKAWPDGFVVRHYAECWECAWARHQRAEHPPKRKRWWRR